MDILTQAEKTSQTRQPQYTYTQRIRDLINEPRVKQDLMRYLPRWEQLCSSLDVIEDTELAIEAYVTGRFGETEGARYLAVYGVLQALVVQQDALSHMCESLSIQRKLDEFDRLAEIRKIRIKSVGHQTKKDRPNTEPVSHHFISRSTLQSEGFQLLSFYEDGTTKFQYVSIVGLIDDQRKCVSDVLASAVSELESRETAHKQEFAMEKLRATFPDTLGYAFQKAGDAINNRELASLGQWGSDTIKRTLDDFHHALGKRGIEIGTYDSIKFAYEQLQYPIERLEAFFGAPEGQPTVNEKDARILLFFVEAKVQELRGIAEELDREYSN